MDAEPPRPARRVAIIDNALDPGLYKPVEHWARYLPAAWEAFRAPEGRLPGRPGDFSHIILTGSEASILERERWVEDESAFAAEAFRRGLSILGSCYGHQLLALALAGPACVGRCREPEIGWPPVRIVAPSRLLGPPGPVYAFSHHRDEVRDLPPGFEVFAASAACPVQAFGVRGRNVWGLQMHPEIDVPAARRFMADLAGRGGPDEALDRAALAEPPRDSGLIRRIVREFLAAGGGGFGG